MEKLTVEQIRRSEFAVVCVVIIFIVSVSTVSLFGDWQNFVRSLSLINPSVILGLLGLSLVNYGVRAWRWQLFSRHLGLRVPALEGAACYFAGFSMTTTPGKIGEMLRLWILERRYGFDYHRTLPVALGDRVSDVNAMLLLVMVSIATQPEYWWGVLIAFFVVLAMTVSLVWPRPAIATVNALYLSFNRKKPSLFAKARRTLRLTASLFTWRLYGGTLLLTIVGWLAECLAFYWLLRELGLPVEFSDAVFVFSFSMLAGAASMLPGGLGGVEAVMIALLIGLDSSFETAVVATAIIRITTLWFAVGLGFLVMPFVLNLMRKQGAPAVSRR